VSPENVASVIYKKSIRPNRARQTNSSSRNEALRFHIEQRQTKIGIKEKGSRSTYTNTPPFNRMKSAMNPRLFPSDGDD
jgi:hypothetical protein